VTTTDRAEPISLADLQLCFEGAIPAVIATAAADGTPNITYLSRVRFVDPERVALSNQFFSKTQRNLAENPRASVLLVDPSTYRQYRLSLAYERTVRRGPLFDQLREDVDTVAALSGMQDVFKLRAADVYRVVQIDALAGSQPLDPVAGADREPASSAQIAELTARLSRCPDLDTIVSATVDGLAKLLGYEHSALLLVDEEARHLYTIASRGFPAEGVGSEVAIGDGVVGIAAARATPIRVGNLRQMAKYSNTVRRAFDAQAGIGPGQEVPMPELPEVQSRVAVPAVALGQVVGVLLVESNEPVAFTTADEAPLSIIASVVANAIEVERARSAADDAGAAGAAAPRAHVAADARTTSVRFFGVDGSVFLDGDYLIKGVAGRILWSLLGQYERDGRVDFTNKEVRLDPTLELPEFRDNLDSRLLLLKRRLDERDATVQIEKTGRGRFRLLVDGRLSLSAGGEP
jgi:predicted pyridoxine 5'-phosphate oxidase superfamily flavin-nucleotide-binding protein